MAIIGTAIAGALGAFGDKPKVPKLKPLDLGAEQLAAIAQNQKALPYASKLASDTNVFSQEQVNKMLELAMPGYSSLRDKATGTISSFLSGEIPGDVSNAVKRNTAGRALYGGYGGTGMSRNLEARDLGLTSMDLTTKGLDAATRWISSARAAPQFDVSSMFVSPLQRAAFDVQERDTKLSRDWLAAQVKALPDPFMRALGQAFINDEGAIMSMVGSAAGGAAGGGGGGSM